MKFQGGILGNLFYILNLNVSAILGIGFPYENSLPFGVTSGKSWRLVDLVGIRIGNPQYLQMILCTMLIGQEDFVQETVAIWTNMTNDAWMTKHLLGLASL